MWIPIESIVFARKYRQSGMYLGPRERCWEMPILNEQSSEKTSLVKTGELLREPPAPMVLQLGSSDDKGAGAFSLSLVWQALLQRLKLAFPLGLALALVSGAALCLFTEPKFRGHATLRITDKQPYVA